MKYINCLMFLLFAFCAHSAVAEETQSANPFPDLYPYAVLADVVYQNEVLIEEACADLGYKLKAFDFVPEVELTFLVAINERTKAQIVAIRGTANVTNAMIDANFPLVNDAVTGVRIHEGFSKSAQALYKKLKPWLDLDTPVHTTGHSLGGAMALIAAMYLRNDHFNAQRVVTFGQPKVTNAPGADSYRDLDITRVVMSGDLVPILPPIDPMDFNNMDVFWHVGQEVILLNKDDYAVSEASDSMMRAAKFVTQELTKQALDQHKMFAYRQQVERRRVGAKLVPYDTGKSLLDLLN